MVGKIYESSFEQNLSCIFIIFLEGAASDLLYGGRAARTLQKSVIEKFTIISWLWIRKRAIYGWKGMEVYFLKKLILHRSDIRGRNESQNIEKCSKINVAYSSNSSPQQPTTVAAHSSSSNASPGLLAFFFSLFLPRVKHPYAVSSPVLAMPLASWSGHASSKLIRPCLPHVVP